MRPERMVDILTTFICRLSWNDGASASWKTQGLSGLYRDCFTFTFTLGANVSERVMNCHPVRYQSRIKKYCISDRLDTVWSDVVCMITFFRHCRIHICAVVNTSVLKRVGVSKTFCLIAIRTVLSGPVVILSMRETFCASFRFFFLCFSLA